MCLSLPQPAAGSVVPWCWRHRVFPFYGIIVLLVVVLICTIENGSHPCAFEGENIRAHTFPLKIKGKHGTHHFCPLHIIEEEYTFAHTLLQDSLGNMVSTVVNLCPAKTHVILEIKKNIYNYRLEKHTHIQIKPILHCIE